MQKRDANGKGEMKKFLGRFIVERSGKSLSIYPQNMKNFSITCLKNGKSMFIPFLFVFIGFRFNIALNSPHI